MRYVPANTVKPDTTLKQKPGNDIDRKPVPVLSTTAIVKTTTRSATPNRKLHDTYYLNNFNYLLDFVSKHYFPLLTTEERCILQARHSLSSNAQKLLARLAVRTPAYFRVSKFVYADIELPTAIDELGRSGFINLGVDSIEQCLPLFTDQELSDALGCSVKGLTEFDPAIWTTPDLLGDSPISKLFANESIIEVNFKQTILTFRLLFFGNLYQDFSSFVLRDLGYQRYEPYVIDSETLLFKTRDQIDTHLAYYECTEFFEQASEAGIDALVELHNATPTRIQTDKALCRRLDRLDNKIARQLERVSAPEIAAIIYRKTVYPPARERLARIYTKAGDATQALHLCHQIIEQPLDSDELDFASSFGQKLAAKTNEAFPAEPKYKPPEILITLAASNLSVEFSVATHYAKTGKCYYLENNLISGIFGLAFWDIIFAPVNGVFFHPFQNSPADFYEPEFSTSRQALIDQRLEDITNNKLSKFVNTHLYHKRGILNPMVNWRMCRKHIIDLALKRIPANHWYHLFTNILTDIRNYRAGQPDLIYFPDDGGYKLVEVKAPGDKLQKNQLRWMKYFHQHAIPHLVVNVEWTDSGDC